jgi:A/G-specific adenine glycosylase
MPKVRTTPRYQAGPEGSALAGALLEWFAVHQRDLPWRRSRDPYRIWVSEVMLQQTRVDTVIPYYERWMERFPTLESLAQADEAAVLKVWEGLGYYSRARNLHSAAREVAARYGGQVPDDPEALRRLKGLGPYTVGAILSIAYNRSVPAVDGNVMRVLSRLYRIDDDIALPATRSAMEALAAQLIPPGQASSFNQALMELGALVCTPASPKCDRCPVSSFCRARADGVQDQLPVKSKAKAPRPVDLAVGVIFHEGRVMLVRRPAEGLLGGLWEFPGCERTAGERFEQALHTGMRERFGVELAVEAHLTSVRHVFSHLVWNLEAFTAHLAPESPVPVESESLRWLHPDEVNQFALPVAHRKVAEHLLCGLGSLAGADSSR